MDANARISKPDAAFDWAMAIGSIWTIGGLFFDNAGHLRHDVDTFFTWDHALVYSGLAFLIGAVGVEAWRCRRDARTLPPGYALSVLGVVLFFVAGASDMINHIFLGFEAGFDGLLSPTHEFIGIALAILFAGPLRSAIAGAPRRLVEQLPAIIAAASILELLHFATDPFFRADPERIFGVTVPHELTRDAFTLVTLHFYGQGAGLVAVLLQSILMMGVLFFLLRSVPLRPGAIVLYMVLGNAMIAMAVGTSWLEVGGIISACIVAGIAGDLFLARYGTLAAHRRAYLAFAFLVPAAYQATFLAYVVALMGGTWWDPLFALGTIFYAGFFSLLLSYLTLVPAGASSKGFQ